MIYLTVVFLFLSKGGGEGCEGVGGTEWLVLRRKKGE